MSKVVFVLMFRVVNRMALINPHSVVIGVSGWLLLRATILPR
jgi:hypothetical protein